MCNLHMVSPLRRMWLPLCFQLGVGFPSVTHCTEQQWMYLCLSTVISSVPTGLGGLAGLRRALEGVSNSGVFIGITFMLVTWRYVKRDWLKGNVSVTYITLIPWSRERRRIIPSPQLLYHRCTAGAHSLGSSAEKIMCVCTRSPFIPVLRGVVRMAKHAHQLSLACFVNTRRWLGSRARSHLHQSLDVMSPFPPSGKEGYVGNWDVFSTNTFCVNSWSGLVICSTSWSFKERVTCESFISCAVMDSPNLLLL